MSDLKADTRRLRECSRSLQRIYDEFTERANPSDGFSAAELGDGRIVDAFSDFAANWKVHRKDLAEQVRTLGVITEDAAKSYDGVDAALANALRSYDASADKDGPR